MAEYIVREDAVSALDVAERYLRNRPAADVVEVVRCKDCKHSELTPDELSYWCDKHEHCLLKDDDFCSYGERINDEA